MVVTGTAKRVRRSAAATPIRFSPGSRRSAERPDQASWCEALLGERAFRDIVIEAEIRSTADPSVIVVHNFFEELRQVVGD